jgi:hypothetical protein
MTTATTVATETYTVFVNSTPYIVIAPPGLDQSNIGGLTCHTNYWRCRCNCYL